MSFTTEPCCLVLAGCKHKPLILASPQWQSSPTPSPPRSVLATILIMDSTYRVIFLTGTPLTITSKFWHSELFWWDLLCNLTLRTFRGGVPVKKITLYIDTEFCIMYHTSSAASLVLPNYNMLYIPGTSQCRASSSSDLPCVPDIGFV